MIVLIIFFNTVKTEDRYQIPTCVLHDDNVDQIFKTDINNKSSKSCTSHSIMDCEPLGSISVVRDFDVARYHLQS